MPKRPTNLSVRGGAPWDNLAGLAQTLGLTLEVFLHRRMGERYFTIRWRHSAIVILAVCAVFHNHQPRPLLLFLAAFVGMCGISTCANIWRRWRKKPFIHSLYSGRPWLMILAPGLDEEMVKRLEPLLVAMAGYGVTHFNMLLGVYLVVAALGFAWSNLLNGLAVQAVNLNDSVVEQELLVERFRAMRGEESSV